MTWSRPECENGLRVEGGADGRRRRRRNSAPVPAPPTAAAVVTIARFVDLESAAFQFVAVELLDGSLCLCIGAHFYEAEATGLTAELVSDDGDRFADARLREQCFELLVGDIESEIADIEFFPHRGTLIWSRQRPG